MQATGLTKIEVCPRVNEHRVGLPTRGAYARIQNRRLGQSDPFSRAFRSRAPISLAALCMCISLLTLAGPKHAFAQGTGTVVLSGTVLDPGGRAIQNASVAAKNEASAAVSKTTTDPAVKFSYTGPAASNSLSQHDAPPLSRSGRSDRSHR